MYHVNKIYLLLVLYKSVKINPSLIDFFSFVSKLFKTYALCPNLKNIDKI